MAGADSALLDFSRPLDVPLLDATVNLFYTSTNNDEVRPPRRAWSRSHGRAARRLSRWRQSSANRHRLSALSALMSTAPARTRFPGLTLARLALPA